MQIDSLCEYDQIFVFFTVVLDFTLSPGSCPRVVKTARLGQIQSRAVIAVAVVLLVVHPVTPCHWRFMPATHSRQK